MTVKENSTELLIEWLRERERVGYERYGGPMKTFCGKDSIREALEEGLDLIQYLFQFSLEFSKTRELCRKRFCHDGKLGLAPGDIVRVYIAGPYTGDGSHVAKEANTKNGIKVFHDLLDLGFKPFLPHLTHFADLVKVRPYQDWMDLDLVYLAVCDALLLIPGESPGARIELDFCRTVGIPVFNSVEELCAFKNG